MAEFRLSTVRTLVLLGAHPDDIEIGAGGLLLLLGEARPGLRVHYVLFSGSPERHAEAEAAAEAFMPGARIDFVFHSIPDGRLPAFWNEAKEVVERAASLVRPDLVLAPWSGDAHQDHRAVARLAPTAFRDALVLNYEIPKWDGDLGRPSVYVPLSEQAARRKVDLLHASFPSQKARDWWDDEVFLGLARLRGVECRTRYAEAFYCHKALVRVATR
jgi:LmbE family N-acetylglucosaminyl deacetylase